MKESNLIFRTNCNGLYELKFVDIRCIFEWKCVHICLNVLATEKSCEVKYTVSELCVTPIQTSSNSTPPLPTTDRAELPPPPPPPPLPKFLRFKLLNTSSKSSLRTDEINIENKNLSRAVTPTLDEPDRSGAVTPTLDEPEEEPPALKKVKLSSSETARTCKQVPSTMNDANNNLKKLVHFSA